MGTGSHVTSLEHVQARLTLSYNRRGNLAIHLISPSGTRSTLLHPRCKHQSANTHTIQYKSMHTRCSHSAWFSGRPHDYSSEGFNDWAFMTTHSWDEKPSGAWTLEIENVAGASDYGKPRHWNIHEKNMYQLSKYIFILFRLKARFKYSCKLWLFYSIELEDCFSDKLFSFFQLNIKS